jgi:Divergent InlB B-repeat domain
MGRSEAIRLSAALLAAAIVTAQASSASVRTALEAGSVSVVVSGPGRVVSDQVGAISCPPSCSTSLKIETTLRLRAEAQSGNHFVEWGDACTGSATQCTVAVEESTRVRAAFAAGSAPKPPPAIPLKVTRSGAGSVTSTPAGIIDCGVLCGTAFSGGATMQLSATAEQGSLFVGWGGSCTGTSVCNLPMTTDRGLTAPFRPQSITPGSSTITVKNPQHPAPGFGAVGIGDVRVATSAGVQRCESTSCSYTFPNGTRLMIEGVHGNFRFWDGLCIGALSRCDLVVAGSGSVTARWSGGQPIDTTYGLNVTRGGGGDVVSNPPGIECGTRSVCNAAFKGDSFVTLTATAASGYAFAEWTGDCSGTGGCRVAMNASRSITAVFRKERHSVRVVTQGVGNGTIESDPPGIACSQTCDYRFPEGTDLVLRARPNAKSYLAAWSGACSGADSCRFTVAGSTQVAAQFEVCAARTTIRFVPVVKRHPRRVVAVLRVAGSATAGVRLLNGRKVIARGKFPDLVAGTQRLRVDVPLRTPRGRYLVELRLIDVCGSTQSLSRKVRIPNP